MKTTDTDHAKAQAESQLASIIEMVTALNNAFKGDDPEAQDSATYAIHDDPLSIQIRSGWMDIGQRCDGDNPAEEYCILLCTGGPAVRMIGSLEDGEPSTAVLEYQDWGTPWTPLSVTGEQEQAMLTYAGQFYFES